MKLLGLAMAGGAFGSGLRYLVNAGLGRILGPGFPWGIFIINVTGCFVMGLVAGTLALRTTDTQSLRTFFATGILGGYTTFSAFSLDFANLVRLGDLSAAALYLAGSVGLSIAGVFAGLALSRAILT